MSVGVFRGTPHAFLVLALVSSTAHADPPTRVARVAFEPIGGETLEVRVDDDWRTVCAERCDAVVPGGSVLRTNGAGRVSSAAFGIDSGRHVVEARSGALASRTIGIVATSVGGAAAGMAGLGMYLLAPNLDPPDCGCTPDESRDRHALFRTETIVLGVGVASLLTGLYLLATTRTTVLVDGVPPPRADASTGGRTFVGLAF